MNHVSNETNNELFLSIVIPVYNEAEYLVEALPELFADFEQVDTVFDVTLVENGSTDGTADAVRGLMGTYPQLRLIEMDEPDYGGAMREGFLQAKGQWVINFDIDYFSADFANSVLQYADTSDVILASKRVAGANDERSYFRRFATWTFNQILRFMLNSNVSDTHGMKALRKSVVDDVAPQVISREDIFDTELVIRAEHAGYRVTEVPAHVVEKREAKSSLLKRIPRTLRGVWRVRCAMKIER